MSSNGRNGVAAVATTTIDAFRSQPLMLLVIVLNILMLGLIFYVGSAQREERATLTKYLIDCQRVP